ncbi:nucleotidyltransferase domain-containing protein [Streptomyces microflavus]|uniref:nucleotidyltransferase domain-containing protein n=1 Tax=Streptomyces microflavus TaxID=1919 RepID=UPI0033D5EE56
MKRERATRLLAEMITRLEGAEWPLGLVEEVYVFGSYARGVLEPNDVDVVVEHGTDKRWSGDSLDVSINGRDSYVGMRQALRGRTRGISFQFRGRSSLLDEGFELFLLWRKGEPFSLARERLALTADPAAGPAPGPCWSGASPPTATKPSAGIWRSGPRGPDLPIPLRLSVCRSPWPGARRGLRVMA